MTINTNDTSVPNPERAPVADRRSEPGRRREPRWVPDGIKEVTVFEDVTATVRDESNGGICLKMPVETQIEMGQHVPVDQEGMPRIGRVCWTTVDHFGSHRFVGLAWITDDEGTGENETSVEDGETSE